MLRPLLLVLSLSCLAIVAAAQATELACTTPDLVLSGTYDVQEVNLACTEGTKLFTIDSNSNVTLNFPEVTQLKDIRFIVLEGGSLIFTGEAATFSDVDAQDVGAVINNSGTVTFNNVVTFSNNTALDGGAIYNDWGSITFSKAATFISNTATDLGGALYVTGGSVVFNDAATFDTTTDNSIYINAGGSVQLPGPNPVTLIPGTDTATDSCVQSFVGTLPVADCQALMAQFAVPTSAPTQTPPTIAPTSTAPTPVPSTAAPTEVLTTSSPTVAITIGEPGTVPPTSTSVTARDLTLSFQITGASTSTFTETDQLTLLTGTATLANVSQDNVQFIYTDVASSSTPGAGRRLDAVPVLAITANVQASTAATADITGATLSASTGMIIGDITVVEVSSGSDSKSNAGLVAGIIVSVIVICGMVGACVFYRRKKQMDAARAHAPKPDEENVSTQKLAPKYEQKEVSRQKMPAVYQVPAPTFTIPPITTAHSEKKLPTVYMAPATDSA